MKNNTDRIVFLDYMRILAFVSVLVGHKFIQQIIAVMLDEKTHASLRLVAEVAYQICYGGAAGVVVFFLTSGYIISHVLQSEPTTEFIIKRIFRIYPLFIFAVIMQALLDRYVSGVPFADFWMWIPRLLLLGDYFGIPPVIGSVEWTLRIEISFYVFMAVMKAVGIMRYQNYLPAVFVVATGLLHYLPPFPSTPGLALAYFSTYAPFLFAGSCIYLIEKKKASINICIAAILIIMYSFFVKTTKYLPDWNNLNYGIYALGLFLTAWLLRKSMNDGPIIRLLSTLTYSVYLFHNWLWNYILMAASSLGVQEALIKPVTLVVLLIFCYAINKTVEEYGLNAGRAVINRFRSSRARTLISTPS